VTETALAGIPELIESDAKNLAGEETGRAHLSASQVSTLLACPQKYDYSYEQKIEPVAVRPALSLGKAFQKAIEYGDPEVGATSILEERSARDQDEQDQAEKDATIVKAAARLYLSRYPVTENSTKEYEYRVQLRNPWTGAYSRTFDLLGFADEVAEEDGQLVLIENKFVGQLSAVSIRRLPLDRQISLAAYGIWRATGREVSKVRYRFTRKPSIRQKKGESVGDFCMRVERDYFDRPDFYLEEQVLYRDQAQLARIEAELWEWAEMVRASRKRSLFVRNTSACTDFGGCEFLPLCVGDPDAPSLYREKQPRKEGQ
jgi:SpoVK/Ycf46/Vps4 family AAA+-type ATPase